MIEDGLVHSPAAERNRIPIGQALVRRLADDARVLEIGSGSGQHAVWFHHLLPNVFWQTTELRGRLGPLQRRLDQEAPELPAPLAVDVSKPPSWPEGRWDAVFSANTLHIMPWGHTEMLLQNAARSLPAGGLLILYGPFHEGGRHDAESNRRFDRMLRQNDPAMGVRDAAEVRQLAAAAGFEPEANLALPANNRLLIFRRRAPLE